MALSISNVRKLLSSLFFEEPALFSERRDVKWKNVKITAVAGIGSLLFILLAIPDGKSERETFSEPLSPRSAGEAQKERFVPSEESTSLAIVSAAEAPKELSLRRVVHHSSAPKASHIKPSQPSDSMILTRPGFIATADLPPGTRIEIELTNSISASTEAVPLIGLVSEDVSYQSEVVVPAKTKAYGEVVFDGAKRARINWKSLELPDGRARAFSAVATGKDGRLGIDGNVHSEALKNTAGQMLTRFVGAYATGSMQTGMLGGSPGGNRNGMRNAVAETARDRSEAFAEDLKTEDRWIELEQGKDTTAILLEPFKLDGHEGSLR